jgi:hypothetical protein
MNPLPLEMDLFAFEVYRFSLKMGKKTFFSPERQYLYRHDMVLYPIITPPRIIFVRNVEKEM